MDQRRAASYYHHQSQHSTNSDSHEVPPIVHYAILVLVLATTILSSLAFVKVNNLDNEAIPDTINVNDFLSKLTAHDEAKAFVGVAPLNIVQINQANLGNLQAQIAGLDVSYLGSYMIQYTDSLIIYNYEADQIRGAVSLAQPNTATLPSDFATKLYSHAETSDLSGEQPAGGQIDASTLATLKSQFPDVYANAKEGDFLLRYQSRLIIYDYAADRIVNAVNLG